MEQLRQQKAQDKELKQNFRDREHPFRLRKVKRV